MGQLLVIDRLEVRWEKASTQQGLDSPLNDQGFLTRSTSLTCFAPLRLNAETYILSIFRQKHEGSRIGERGRSIKKGIAYKSGKLNLLRLFLCPYASGCSTRVHTR